MYGNDFRKNSSKMAGVTRIEAHLPFFKKKFSIIF